MIKYYLAIAAAGALFAAGYQWRDMVEDGRRLDAEIERQKAQAQINKIVDAIAKQNQRDIGKIRVENKTIYNETKREVLRDVVYKECIITDDGLRLINQSRD